MTVPSSAAFKPATSPSPITAARCAAYFSATRIVLAKPRCARLIGRGERCSCRVLDHLRAAQGLLGLRERFGAGRLEAACARALKFGAPSYRTIKQILKEGFDQQPDLLEVVELDPAYRGAARFGRDPSGVLH